MVRNDPPDNDPGPPRLDHYPGTGLPPVRCCRHCGAAYGSHFRDCPEFAFPPQKQPDLSPDAQIGVMIGGAICGAIVALALYVLVSAAG